MNKLVKHNTALDVCVEIDDICTEVAGGVTLARYCRERNMAFGEVLTWIKRDPERHHAYREACELRKEWAAQTLCDMIMTIAQFDPAQIRNQDGTFKPFNDWPDSCRAALVSFDIENDGTMHKVRFLDRLRAGELIGKTLGIFAEKVKVEGEVTLAELITRAAKDGYSKDDSQNDKKQD